jgi:23S rRNA (cytosine1962-C5)-methyltransferase
VVDRALIRSRLEQALQRRQRLLPRADAYRLVHGEADFLPGIFVDRYGDSLVLQTTCAGADRLEPELVTLLTELLAPVALVIRDDSHTRARENLPQHVTLVRGVAPVRAQYHEGEQLLAVDLLEDQKTGSFLDQALNHVEAQRYAQGEALDCFTYHGGFALQLARVCPSVEAFDISEPALTRARANAERAGLQNITFTQANVFDVLPVLYTEGKRYDTIVLDPPAFAGTKKTLDAAMRAYKEVNLRAMRLLRPNGILISCSCSGRVDGAMFDEMLVKAAHDAKRSIHFVERRSAGPDHPVLAGVPETDYLKCRVLMVV